MHRPTAATTLLLTTAAAFFGGFALTLEGLGPTEAPAAFDNKTNGFISQTDFDTARGLFEEREEIATGLGPVYNAQSCAECHQNPVTGSSSQISELRAGHNDGSGNFVDAPGGSLINDRAINARLQERVPEAEKIRTFRMATNTLGGGFVESIDSATLQAIAASQPLQSGGLIHGEAIQVRLLEQPGATSIGRFGWKDQHASLLSFSGDAYLNEMGITNPLFPAENTSMGNSVAAFDTVPDPEDQDDFEAFAAFMRATKAPPRDTALANTPDAIAGGLLFNQIGCNICHVTSITTAPAYTSVNGGAFVVPPALGDKIIHPFSDFLLHDIATGDGIVQNGGQGTANKLRTAPLWGVRVRDRLMHDGLTFTFREAILRHGGEADGVITAFKALLPLAQNKIITFLKSL